MTGFTLNWFLEDSNGSQLTEKVQPSREDWTLKVSTPNYEESLLTEMVQLSRQLRLQNMTKGEILMELIRQKVKVLEDDEMCSLEQLKSQNLKKAFSKLVLHDSIEKTEGPPSDEDIKTGYDLFQAIVHCPSMKLFRFVDQLLSTESSRTIIQTFVRLLQSDVTSSTLAKQFYNVMATTFNLQFGNALLATSTNAQLHTMIRNGSPFIANNTVLVEKCLKESDCDEIQSIFQKLGEYYMFFLSHNLT